MGHFLTFYTDSNGPFFKWMGLWRMAPCLPNHCLRFAEWRYPLQLLSGRRTSCCIVGFRCPSPRLPSAPPVDKSCPLVGHTCRLPLCRLSSILDRSCTVGGLCCMIRCLYFPRDRSQWDQWEHFRRQLRAYVLKMNAQTYFCKDELLDNSQNLSEIKLNTQENIQKFKKTEELWHKQRYQGESDNTIFGKRIEHIKGLKVKRGSFTIRYT